MTLNPLQEFEHRAKPFKGGNFEKADFRYAQYTEKPTSVVTLTPGSGGDGRYLANDPFWAQWAKDNNAALIGCRFTDPIPRIDEDYVNAKAGTGKALLEALEVFDADHLPLFMYGHSAGGGFNYEFACAFPGKVAAFIVNKGGVYYTALAPSATRATPAIFFVGVKDMEYRVNILAGLFSMNRAVSMANGTTFKWDWWLRKNEAHEEGRSEVYSMDLFTKIIKERNLNKELK